jgi:autotransporter-associated beta strand protein
VVVSNSFTVWQNQFYGTVTIDATSQVTDFNSGTGDGFYGQIVNNASFTAAGNNPMYIRGTDSNTGSGLWIASSSSATAGLALYKTNAIAIPGNVEVRAGSSVRLYGVGGNQIADTSVVNLLTNGVFHLNGLAEGVGIVTSRATAAVIQLGTGGTLTNGLSNVSGLYMGSIAGTGAVIQAGSGMWTLQGNSTYRGSMEVASGGLIVDAGASLAMTSLTVGASGTLGGSGTISNFFSTGLDMTIVSGGKLAPGTSPGTMTLNLGTGSLDVSGVGAQALEFELGTNSSDQVSMLTGTLKIGSGVLGFNEFKFTDLTFIPKNTTFTLFSLNDTAASLSGTLDAADKTGTFGGGAYTGTLGVSGNDITLTVIPEPATLGTVGLGALAMLILRRARKQK